jgi:hypothetical protein
MADRRTRLPSAEADAIATTGTESFSLVVHEPDCLTIESITDKMVANRAHVSRTNLTDDGTDDIGNPGDSDPYPSYSQEDQTPFINQGSGVGEGEMEPEHGGIGDKAGIILVRVCSSSMSVIDVYQWWCFFFVQGIHNVFVVIPQFLVTGLSSIIFAIFEPGRTVLRRSIADTAYSGTVHADTAWSLNVLAPVRRAEGETRPFDSIGLMFR